MPEPLQNDAPGASAARTPSEIYPRLFGKLDEWGFDKKLVADARAVAPVDAVEAEAARLPRMPDDRLDARLRTWFELPGANLGNVNAGNFNIEIWIEKLWDVLVRTDRMESESLSLIPLPNPYVVPGGMFRESYYWDSYFTLLGLRARPRLASGIVDNLAFLIDRYGFVPNGNRTYYLSRSQPPLFYAATLESGIGGAPECWSHYLPQLLIEHAFWMDGAEGLPPSESARRVVRFNDGSLLNRYYDDDPRPRDESPGGRDAEIASRASDRPSADVFRDIRAACESGWDFSSRWLGDRRSLETIRTTSIVPADLNAFLFGLENAIAYGCEYGGAHRMASSFRAKAVSRHEAMTRWLWNDKLGLFDDYDCEHGLRGAVTAAALAPLFAGVATRRQASRTAQRVKADLLAPGGLLATQLMTGEQWDSPNGWAPLQWIGAVGLRQYKHHVLANEIATRWLSTVKRVYAETGRLTEKYDVVACSPGGGGEYPLQDGFGWTNGVTAAFWDEFPEAERPAKRSR